MGAGFGQRCPEVDPGEAARLVEGGAVLLDVREDAEWTAGHAPGARHIALGRLAAEYLTLPTDRRLVAVCRSGHRSQMAAVALVNAGYDAVNLAGGMQAWLADGLPVVTPDGGPGWVA